MKRFFLDALFIMESPNVIAFSFFESLVMRRDTTVTGSLVDIAAANCNISNNEKFNTYLLLVVILPLSLFTSDASVCDKQKKPCAFNIYVVKDIRMNVIIVPIIAYMNIKHKYLKKFSIF